jgi:hypothetical protein
MSSRNVDCFKPCNPDPDPPKSALKGHGNEADFLGVLQKSFPHESLTLHFELFQFSLRIRGDICNREKRLLDSLSRGVDKIAYRYKFFQTFK